MVLRARRAAVERDARLLALGGRSYHCILALLRLLRSPRQGRLGVAEEV